MGYAVLIPSYKPDGRIVKLVEQLLQRRKVFIVVVDDGSGENYIHIFKQLENMGCHILHHAVNHGKGASIKTGIAYLRSAFDTVVTADGDGQHTPADILRLCDVNNPDALALGVRDFSGASVPFKSKWGNQLSSLYFRVANGKYCPDTQTGLRAIPAKLFALAVSTPGERYDYEMNFLTAAATRFALEFVPIETVYDDNNSSSHFRAVRDSFLIYKTPLKYLCSSLICALVDLGTFTFLRHMCHGEIIVGIFAATVIARLFSGVINYTLNSLWCFDTKRLHGVQGVKYAMLFVCQMTASWMLVSLLSTYAIYPTAAKAIVDGILFIISYRIQSNFIFSKKENELENF